MAQFKYRKYLDECSSGAFDTRHAPATVVQNPGIYRCCACGDEVVVGRRSRLPPHDHHRHAEGTDKIEWQLVVHAQQSR